MKISRALIKSCIPYTNYYIFSFACLFIANLLLVLIPYLVKQAIDQDIIETGSFYFYPLVIILTAIVLVVFRILSRILIYRACREQEHDLRQELLDKLLKTDSKELANCNRGDLITNMLEDTTQVRLMVGFGLVQAVNIAMLYLGTLPLMYMISPKLTLISVAPYPLLLIWIAIINTKLYKINLIVKEKQADLADFTAQSIHGIHVIHSHSAKSSMGKAYSHLVDNHYNYAWKAARLEIIMMPVMIFLASLGEWAVIRYGVPMISLGEITNGDFLALHGYIGNLLFASISVGFGVSTFNRGYTSMERLLGRYSMIEEKGQAEGTLLPNIEYHLKNIEFIYPGTKKVSLKIQDLALNSNETIGVFGPIGSGKSSLFRLLMGFYAVENGEIYFNSERLSENNLKDLRASVVYVAQELFLFSRTIKENLDFYSNLSDLEIQQALELTCLDSDILGFQDGLDTLVGERGVRLSQGQKQRIAIARAILKKPSFLILDDCFSALDTVVEEKILKNLLKNQKRGLIISSHRISTLKHCSRILVIKDNQIEADGSHEELMQNNSYYRHNYELQKDFA